MITRNPKVPIISAQAFSLIDCLVGLAITTIIISISVPSIRDNKTRTLVKKEARLLQQELESLNLAAHIQAKDLIWRHYPNSYKTLTTDNQILSTRYLEPGLSLTIQNQNNQIIFYKTGTATPATIFVSKSDFQCKLVISLRARITTIC